MKKQLLLVASLLCTLSLIAQENTVGLLSYIPSKTYEGYNLIYPHNQPNVYLLNNCGEIVHVWEDESNFRPGNTAYLMENGDLIKTKRDAAVAGDRIWAGGGGAIVEIRNWDNELLWSFSLNTETERLHHDIEVLPNGNILMIAWELIPMEEALAAGRDSALLHEGELWPDKIIEVQPIGTDEFEIVWEWRAWDHLIQDRDANKPNFGVIAEHPERMDINYDTQERADWMHSNYMDYDPVNRQILLSIPYFDEVWVIDHTTTTAQAAGSSGGFSGLGGDIMYRWGNPVVYDSGDSTNQRLFFQHNARYAYDFLTPMHPNYGDISVFNNRVGDSFSSANIFDNTFDMYTWSFPKIESIFGPENFNYFFFHPEPSAIFSTGLSSVQVLPNGNVLICAGRQGYILEVTPDEEIVWEYEVPLLGGSPVAQGIELDVNNNLTFSVTRYPMNFEAFNERDLSPKGFIELEPNEGFCDDLISSTEEALEPDFKIYPNPTYGSLTIEWESMKFEPVQIWNLFGRIVLEDEVMGGRVYWDISDFNPGMYLIKVGNRRIQKLLVE